MIVYTLFPNGIAITEMHLLALIFFATFANHLGVIMMGLFGFLMASYTGFMLRQIANTPEIETCWRNYTTNPQTDPYVSESNDVVYCFPLSKPEPGILNVVISIFDVFVYWLFKGNI